MRVIEYTGRPLLISYVVASALPIIPAAGSCSQDERSWAQKLEEARPYHCSTSRAVRFSKGSDPYSMLGLHVTYEL